VASCKVPIVVRQSEAEVVKWATGDESTLYSLVSDCYVHAVMDGEKAGH